MKPQSGDGFHVGVLAYDGCFATEVFGLIDLLAMANLVTERSRHDGVLFRTSVLGRGSSIVASGGHRLSTRRIDTPIDALVVPGFRAVDEHTIAAALARLTPEIARITLVADNRVSQAPYVDDRLLTIEGDRFVRDAQRWLARHLNEPYDLCALAAEFDVSTRTMLRRFSRETGESPLTYLQSARIEAAKRLLESPGSTVAEVMGQVGYHDITSFRRLFTRHVGISPGRYRTNFQRRTGSVDAVRQTADGTVSPERPTSSDFG